MHQHSDQHLSALQRPLPQLLPEQQPTQQPTPHRPHSESQPAQSRPVSMPVSGLLIKSRNTNSMIIMKMTVDSGAPLLIRTLVDETVPKRAFMQLPFQIAAISAIENGLTLCSLIALDDDPRDRTSSSRPVVQPQLLSVVLSTILQLAAAKTSQHPHASSAQTPSVSQWWGDMSHT